MTAMWTAVAVLVAGDPAARYMKAAIASRVMEAHCDTIALYERQDLTAAHAQIHSALQIFRRFGEAFRFAQHIR